MENNQKQKLTQDFKEHIKSLHEVYEQSNLKEKHRLNEHIKHLIKTYGQLDVNFIEEDLKNDSSK